MLNRRTFALPILLMVAILSLGATVSSARSEERRAHDEMEFGYQAAKRGYWQEALMRFRNADRLTPDQPRILNNIAVALEATAAYDEARGVYLRGLEIDPGNRQLQKNYASFLEFYREYVADVDEKDAEADDATEPSDGEAAEEPEARAPVDDTGSGGDHETGEKMSDGEAHHAS